MNRKDNNIRKHEQHADAYDDKARECGYFGGEILFGLCFEYVSPGSRLLDIGIGTGLSSKLFAKAGLDVYGLDGSAEMLSVCEAKRLAKELRQHDLNDLPLPYASDSFDYVVSCGVFHFFGDLSPLFTDVCRVLKPGGIFSFTLMRTFASSAAGPGTTGAGYRFIPSEEGIDVYLHDQRSIRELLRRCRFEELKEQLFSVHDGNVFTAHVLRKTA